MGITYNTASGGLSTILRATSGGTVFSSNLSGTTNHDLFTDTAVVNDAIYFGGSASVFSDLVFNVGTAVVATGMTLVWEYYQAGGVWTTMDKLKDDTNGFTVTGVNTVRFPFHWQWSNATVNALSRLWVRCRISALGSITEGGANITTAISAKDGAVRIDGYTDGAPTSFLAVYNFLNINYSYIKATYVGNYFDFRWVKLVISSRLLSLRETVEIGINGGLGGVSTSQLTYDFSYLTCGTKVGSSNGKDGSIIIVNAPANNNPIQFSTATKLYDTLIQGKPTSAAGYPQIQGEALDCNFEMRPNMSLAAPIIKNCRFQLSSGGIICNGIPTIFENNKFSIGAEGFTCYNTSFSTKSLDYIFEASSGLTLCSLYQTSRDGIVYDFINPLKNLPAITDTNKPVMTTYAATASANIPHVFFYNSTLDAYTDYTTQASSAALSDVPIFGEVNDCLYMDTANVYDMSSRLFTCTNVTNDYVYVYEYYQTGQWRTKTVYDLTSNFTKSNYYFMVHGISDYSLFTVNGIASYWHRLRIVTKGSGTPMVSMIKQRDISGVCDWKLNEKYDIVFKAIDGSSNPILGVNVKSVDNYGVVQFSGTSVSDGTIAITPVNSRQWFFDPFIATPSTQLITEKNFSPYTTRIRKYGYVFQQLTQNITSIQLLTTVLNGNAFTSSSPSEASAYTGIVINGATESITVTQSHSIQELYDYSQWWASQPVNMGYAEPLTTTDGAAFASGYALTIDGCALTGSGALNLGSNAVTLANNGGSSLIIVASDGTHTTIQLSGVVLGSRVQLYDVTTDSELYNAVLTSTTLTVPAVWTSDHDIRIRVMWVSGASAKQWYETVGVLKSTGLSLSINQMDDTVYNAVGIDGGTISECSIVGSIMVININDSDNTTTAQRLYAYEVYWLSTVGGIRDQALYIGATDTTHFVFEGGLKIKNSSPNPLQVTGGNIVPASGPATDVLDMTGGSIFLNFNRVEGFAYMTQGGLTPSQDSALLSAAYDASIARSIVSNPQVSNDVSLVRKMSTNKVAISGDGLEVITFDDDGVTPLVTYAISENQKVRTRI